MRSFITAILVAIALALVFALVLNSIQQSTEMAFTTDGVRLDAASITGGTVGTEMADPIILAGVFTILGAIIAAAAGYFGPLKAANAQVEALKDQSEEDRRRFQQGRHQRKYEVAVGLESEARRLAQSAQERIPIAEASRSGQKHPAREQMTIPGINRGEREDIGLLSDDLQDEARWRCKRCGAFIDEILDVSADGQRKSCPVCNNMTRIIGAQVSE
jgi:hypothetical protein